MKKIKRIVQYIIRFAMILSAILAVLILVIACVKSVLFGSDGYNPADLLTTATCFIFISSCLLCISSLIGDTHIVQVSGYSDFGINCHKCFELMDDCECYKDD